MKIVIKSVLLASMLITVPVMTTGCAGLTGVKSGTAEVSQRMGFVTSTKEVMVESDKKEVFAGVGAAIGAGVGNLFGDGLGKTVATIGGGLAGGAAGAMASKDEGQKLTVQMEDRRIIQITKAIGSDKKFERGDYVIVTFDKTGQASDVELADKDVVNKLIDNRPPLVVEREKLVKVYVDRPVTVEKERIVEKKVVVEKKVYVPSKTVKATETAPIRSSTTTTQKTTATQEKPAKAANPMDFFN